jgi:uncharacterized membrane protein YfcA
MSERFELSFKNKEVRIWLYLMIPTIAIGSVIIFYSEQEYQYFRLLTLVIALLIFYTWRYFYRRRQK